MNISRLTILATAISTTLAAGVAFSQTTGAPRPAPPAFPGSKMADTPPSPVTMPTPVARATPSGGLRSHDRKFVNSAGEAGAAEVAMGKLAKDHAASADVKNFASRMVSDQLKAGDQLKAIASTKSGTPPDQPSKKDQADIDQLSKLQGADFDKAYVAAQLSAHTDAVALFTWEAKGGKDADLKQFATNTLPTLQEHLKMVTELSKTPKP